MPSVTVALGAFLLVLLLGADVGSSIQAVSGLRDLA
jgi:hypothetical protein